MNPRKEALKLPYDFLHNKLLRDHLVKLANEKKWVEMAAALTVTADPTTISVELLPEVERDPFIARGLVQVSTLV